MFRKPVHLSGEHAVSGADRKKLRRALAAKFAVSDDALDVLLPPKGDVRVAKVASPSRALVYTADDPSAEGLAAPVVVDTSGKGDFIPTVFALWRCPSLLRPVVCKHAGVSSFLVGGADLMVPGVQQASVDSLATAAAGTLCAVFVPGNPCAVAVGALTPSSERKAADKGRLLTVVHFYRDSLWELADKEAQLPNEGFLPDRVESMMGGCAADDGSYSEDCNAAAASTDDAAVAPAPHESLIVTAGDGAAEDGAASSAVDAPPDDGGKLSSSEEMDALLDACLLQALRTRIKDKDLPLLCGALLTTHLLPCRPEGSHVDVKKSSHKKLGKFVQAKATDGLLTVREDKRTGDLLITGVNRRHPALAGHTRHVTTGEAAQPSDGQAGGIAPLVCEQWLTATGAVKPWFQAAGAQLDALYTPADVNGLLDAYLTREGLDKRGSTAQRVLLDPVLWTALSKAGSPALVDGAATTELLRQELSAALVAACGHLTVIRRGDETVTMRKGAALPTVQLALKSRAGGKRVTVVTGLEPFLVDIEAFAAQLRERCASAVAIVDLPRPSTLAAKAPPPREVVVQGEVAAIVVEHLTSVWLIPKACVPIPAGAKGKY